MSFDHRRAGRAFLRLFIVAAMASVSVESARAQPATAAAKLDAGAFFSRPDIAEMALSPDGRWVAASVKGKNDRLNLMIIDLDGKEPPTILVQFYREDVVNLRWVNNDWILFGAADIHTNDNRRRGRGLLAITRTAERKRQIIKSEWESNFPSPGIGPFEANHRFLSMGPWGSTEIIVGEYVYDGNGELDKVRPIAIDIATGTRRHLGDQAPPHVHDWVFDHQGKPRAALSVRSGRATLHWRDDKGERWQQLAEFSSVEPDLLPEAISPDGELFFTTADSNGFLELRRAHAKPGLARSSGDVLLTTPGFSASASTLQSRKTGEWLGVKLDTEMSWIHWRNPAIKRIQEEVDAALSDRTNVIDCGDCEHPKRVLVRSASDRDPGEFLVYEPATKKWQRLGYVKSGIQGKNQTGMEFHRFKARDGLEVPVWISRPPGASKMPAVVLVHGGPWVRGSHWAWDAEVQFLASRGYVVIQPEFRGSSGFGYRLFRAGWKQWGQAMQDDVSDALKFAVAKGWVDADRVCIAGQSYGGYATMMGLIKDPDQYRCGVAWTGVSDPLLLFEAHWSNTSNESKRFSMPVMIGDPVKDAAMLASVSPLKQAARVKAPLLLAYGAKDIRVPLDHGDRMRKALVAAGNPPEWILYDNEGHGWSRIENQIDFWTRVEKFLERNLKPKP
jgi:dipeptidyl aminopeptidase/acylaminoacyl peptidase